MSNWLVYFLSTQTVSGKRQSQFSSDILYFKTINNIFLKTYVIIFNVITDIFGQYL